MSSPARSSASGASAGQGGGASSSSNNVLVDDAVYHFPSDLISVHDRKEAALTVLRSDLLAALQKEVKSLEEDDWMFSCPRSQIHLVLRSGYQWTFHSATLIQLTDLHNQFRIRTCKVGNMQRPEYIGRTAPLVAEFPLDSQFFSSTC